jgi:hypothetical protein
MEHIAALLLVVGCSGDLRDCTELPAPVPIYETVEECGAERSPVLTSMRGMRDKVFATCVYVDPAMAEEDAELVWDVTEDAGLVAEITFDGNSMVASAGSSSISH